MRELTVRGTVRKNLVINSNKKDLAAAKKQAFEDIFEHQRPELECVNTDPVRYVRYDVSSHELGMNPQEFKKSLPIVNLIRL